MRVLAFLLVALSCVFTAYAWTKEDYEIFDLVSALEGAEGKGTTFYSHLNLEPGATTGEINKAYRKKSLELHPDKNPGVKDIQARFARLGVITQILRSPEGRERYNFFYKNGVPKWRGTGYYYSRYRPTLSHTLIFLALLTSLLHLLVMNLNYNRDRKRVEYFERSAKNAAGVGLVNKIAENGGNITPVTNGANITEGRRRKVKVAMVEGSEYGGQLELIVQGEEVYIPHDDGTLEPLSGLATPPSYFRTWPFILGRKAIQQITPFLPESVRSQLPPVLLPPPRTAAANGSEEAADEVPTPTSRRARSKHQAALRAKSRSNTNTPRDSPATTELESEEDGEAEVEVAEGVEGEGEKKPKKKGLGKAGGMRRRKMAMKK